MIVIADTSPIHYLILIGEIDLLPKLYDQIVISRGVLDELTAEAAPEELTQWFSAMPGWMNVKSPGRPIEKELSDLLDLGESEAIQLALELKADLLLIDEKLGREMATERGLQIVGTIGILALASERGLIDLERIIIKLEKTNFYITPDLKEYLLGSNI